MARNKKLINNAENHLVVGSLEVLGDVSGGNIQTIKRSVDNLQTSYTKVAARQKDYWSALSEDSLITPIEKIQLKKEWECIDLTYTTIYGEASDRSVLDTSTIIAYINAYSNLRTYLFTTLGLFDEMSENTEIANRDVFNTYFSNYYACENLVQTALVIGTIEALDFVTVGTLDEDGNEGDVVIYQGEFYQWVNGRWKKIGTNGYCGCLTSLPTEIDGNYFLAADNFSGTVALKSPEGKYYIAPENKRYTSFRYFEKAFIYEYMNGQWNKITDEYDYKYIVAFSDYYNLTGKMPAVWQNSLDELADGVSGLNTLFTQQAQLIESYRAAIWGNLAVQETSIQQQILNSNENISTLDGKYDDLDELTEQFLSDYYISDEELGTIAAKYDFTPAEYEAMKASVDSINGDLSLIHSVYSQTKAILDTYKTASLTDEVIAKDIQDILSDQQVTTAELEALQTKYSLSTADYNSLTALFTSYNETATNFAKALVILQTKNGVSEAEINAMLGNLTAAQYAAMIAQYGTDINGLTTEIARKIEHIPVYLGMVQSKPTGNSIKVGDWFTWDGVNNYPSGDFNSLHFKRGYAYKYKIEEDTLPAIIYDWEELNPTSTANSSYYMTALKDILTQTDVITSQAFGVLYANAFFANSAVLEALKVARIEIAEGGYIMTEGYTSNGDNGFLLDGNTGTAEFNNGVFKKSCIFMGEIKSGPLELTKDTPTGRTVTYYADTDLYGTGFLTGSLTSQKVRGTYNGISFSYYKADFERKDEYVRTGYIGEWPYLTPTFEWQAKKYTYDFILYDEDMNEIFNQHTEENANASDYGNSTKYQQVCNRMTRLDYDFSYITYISTDAMTFKLKNLPTSQPSEPGIVYRSGNTLCIS